MNKKEKISDYTETEFLEFIRTIFRENSAPTDTLLDPLLNQFRKIVEHPDGTDLIYYPPSGDCTPESIVADLKSWLSTHDKPGFKV